MSLSPKADRTLLRAGVRSRRYIRMELRAPQGPPGKSRMPLSLALVIDRSGSMAGQKLEMAREAVLRAIQGLRPEDRFSVVAYTDSVDVLVPSTHAAPLACAQAERRVRALRPGNATNLCGGWLRGCEQAGLHLGEEAVGRCLLLTDGLANVGITDHDEIVRHATALRARRLSTSVFGVGADFEETLLRRMSSSGGGNFYYIENTAQIPDFLAGEVGNMLELVAPDAALLVQAEQGVGIRSLNDFPCRRSGTTWRIELGSLLSGQAMDPVLSVTFPEGKEGSRSAVRVSLVDRSRTLAGAAAVVFRYATPAENERQPRERAVERRVSELYAAKAAQMALERNRTGDFAGARQWLEACRRSILEYAGDDAEICTILDDLNERASRYSEGIPALSFKGDYTGTIGVITMSSPTMPGTLGW